MLFIHSFYLLLPSGSDYILWVFFGKREDILQRGQRFCVPLGSFDVSLEQILLLIVVIRFFFLLSSF